jgi:hypothetical protein
LVSQYSKGLFIWAEAFEFLKKLAGAVENLAGEIFMLAFVIYILLFCTPKTEK